ncbi:MAG: formate dehydrogenase accessory sulfurtransferase FdhD [Tepidisphaeraceae bacterium]
MESPECVRFDQVFRLTADLVEESADDVAREEPLEIRARGRAVSITMRTPGHDAELAAGFLITEGLVKRPGDILKIDACDRNEEGNLLNVLLAPEVYVDFDKLTRHVFAASSCVLCGKATIDAIRANFPPIACGDANDAPPDLSIDVARVLTLMDTMRAAQATFDRTGGLHAAALFDERGELVVLREDVGRHNAVDKVLGHALFAGLLPLRRHVLLVSGRTSFEIMQKALAGGVPIVAAASAPSSLAVEFARANGQTLVGFLRANRMNVYAHAHRIQPGIRSGAGVRASAGAAKV